MKTGILVMAAGLLGAVVVGYCAAAPVVDSPPIDVDLSLLADPPQRGLAVQESNQVGRYRLHSSNLGLLLIDTATGHCWQRSGGAWLDLGLPPRTSGRAAPGPKPINTDRIYDGTPQRRR